MRTTIIPAQITTVEDRIAGNLSLSQILILMAPIFWTAIVYTLFIPSMHLALYKLPLILAVLFASLILSLRIQNKLVLEWLVILLTYNLRPKYYVFNKNDYYLRTLHLPVFEKKSIKLFKTKSHTSKAKKPMVDLNIGKLIQFENLVSNPKSIISYKTGRRGINVAFEQVKE